MNTVNQGVSLVNHTVSGPNIPQIERKTPLTPLEAVTNFIEALSKVPPMEGKQNPFTDPHIRKLIEGFVSARLGGVEGFEDKNALTQQKDRLIVQIWVFYRFLQSQGNEEDPLDLFKISPTDLEQDWNLLAQTLGLTEKPNIEDINQRITAPEKLGIRSGLTELQKLLSGIVAELYLFATGTSLIPIHPSQTEELIRVVISTIDEDLARVDAFVLILTPKQQKLQPLHNTVILRFFQKELEGWRKKIMKGESAIPPNRC